MRRLRFAAVALAASALLAGCPAKENATAGQPPAAMTEVAVVETALAKLTTENVSFSLDVKVSGWNTWQTSGTGQVTQSALAMDLPGMQLLPHWLYSGKGLELILIDKTLYVGIESLSEMNAQSLREAGASWRQMDLSNPEANSLGLASIVQQARQYTPQRLTEMLLTSKDLRRQGSEILDGTVLLREAVRRPQFDNNQVHAIDDFFRVAQATDASFRVWINADGSLRRVSVTMRSAQGAMELDLKMEPPGKAIEPPPPAKVLQV